MCCAGSEGITRLCSSVGGADSDSVSEINSSGMVIAEVRRQTMVVVQGREKEKKKKSSEEVHMVGGSLFLLRGAFCPLDEKRGR